MLYIYISLNINGDHYTPFAVTGVSKSRYCSVRDAFVQYLSNDDQCPTGSGAIECCNGWMMWK